MFQKNVAVILSTTFVCVALLIGVVYIWNVRNACRATASGRKLHIGLYYECLCPGSRALITENLLPIYNDIKDLVELRFVPFGNAQSMEDGHSFECQHGARECTGNLIQSCVLDAIGYEQDVSMEFIGCQMADDADETGRECAESVFVTYDELFACQSGFEGIKLQLQAEERTNNVDASYVPFVVFNQIPNEREQSAALKDFQKIVCEKLAEIYCATAMPSICSKALSDSVED